MNIARGRRERLALLVLAAGALTSLRLVQVIVAAVREEPVWQIEELTERLRPVRELLPSGTEVSYVSPRWNARQRDVGELARARLALAPLRVIDGPVRPWVIVNDAPEAPMPELETPFAVEHLFASGVRICRTNPAADRP